MPQCIWAEQYLAAIGTLIDFDIMRNIRDASSLTVNIARDVANALRAADRAYLNGNVTHNARFDEMIR